MLGLQDRDSTFRRGVFDPTPFPPGVGGGRSAEANSQSFEVITADRAIDESNVGNRMLRNMGWQEGLVSFLTLKLSKTSFLYYYHRTMLSISFYFTSSIPSNFSLLGFMDPQMSPFKIISLQYYMK